MRSFLRAAPIYSIWAAALFSDPVAAQSIICSDRGEILDRLSAEYAESVVARALTNDGTLLEITSAADGSTWTLILTMPAGQTCLVSAGEAWQVVAPKPQGNTM